MSTFLLPLAFLPLALSPSALGPLLSPGSSQQPQQSAVADPRHSTANVDAASPEMLSLIQAISGRWEVDMKFEPGPEMPNGARGKGEELWKALADGLVLADEENFELPQGTIHLLGLSWWDGARKEFKGMECINQNPHSCDLKGALQDVSIKWDGKQLTIEMQQTSPGGKKSLWHETFSEITPNSFLQVGESWDPGGQHRRVVTVHATRLPEK